MAAKRSREHSSPNETNPYKKRNAESDYKQLSHSTKHSADPSKAINPHTSLSALHNAITRIRETDAQNNGDRDRDKQASVNNLHVKKPLNATSRVDSQSMHKASQSISSDPSNSRRNSLQQAPISFDLRPSHNPDTMSLVAQVHSCKEQSLKSISDEVERAKNSKAQKYQIQAIKKSIKDIQDRLNRISSNSTGNGPINSDLFVDRSTYRDYTKTVNIGLKTLSDRTKDTEKTIDIHHKRVSKMETQLETIPQIESKVGQLQRRIQSVEHHQSNDKQFSRRLEAIEQNHFLKNGYSLESKLIGMTKRQEKITDMETEIKKIHKQIDEMKGDKERMDKFQSFADDLFKGENLAFTHAIAKAAKAEVASFDQQLEGKLNQMRSDIDANKQAILKYGEAYEKDMDQQHNSLVSHIEHTKTKFTQSDDVVSAHTTLLNQLQPILQPSALDNVLGNKVHSIFLSYARKLEDAIERTIKKMMDEIEIKAKEQVLLTLMSETKRTSRPQATTSVPTSMPLQTSPLQLSFPGSMPMSMSQTSPVQLSFSGTPGSSGISAPSVLGSSPIAAQLNVPAMDDQTLAARLALLRHQHQQLQQQQQLSHSQSSQQSRQLQRHREFLQMQANQSLQQQQIQEIQQRRQSFSNEHRPSVDMSNMSISDHVNMSNLAHSSTNSLPIMTNTRMQSSSFDSNAATSITSSTSIPSASPKVTTQPQTSNS